MCRKAPTTALFFFFARRVVAVERDHRRRLRRRRRFKRKTKNDPCRCTRSAQRGCAPSRADKHRRFFLFAREFVSSWVRKRWTARSTPPRRRSEGEFNDSRRFERAFKTIDIGGKFSHFWAGASKNTRGVRLQILLRVVGNPARKDDAINCGLSSLVLDNEWRLRSLFSLGPPVFLRSGRQTKRTAKGWVRLG